MGIGYEHLTARGNKHVRLDLYEHGLTATVKGRIHAVRYDKTRITQHNVLHTGATGYTSYRYELSDISGQKIALCGRSDGVATKGHFRNAKEWGPALQEAATLAKLPGALATLRAGGTLTFGKLLMTAVTLGTAAESVKWSQIDEVGVSQGWVRVKAAGRWRALAATGVGAIPDFFLFLTLADRLREEARGH